jgi:hypothetical protein
MLSTFSNVDADDGYPGYADVRVRVIREHVRVYASRE